MDKRNKETKELYKFLVLHGVLFAFLGLLRTTKFKTLQEHCEINRPVYYIIHMYLFAVLPVEERPFWDNLHNEWKLHLEPKENETRRNQEEISESKRASF